MSRAAEHASVRRDADEVAEWIQANLGPDATSSSASMPVVRQYRDYRLEWMMKSGGTDVVLKGLENGTIRFAAEHT